jgi:hypothetical protein
MGITVSGTDSCLLLNALTVPIFDSWSESSVPIQAMIAGNGQAVLNMTSCCYRLCQLSSKAKNTQA